MGVGTVVLVLVTSIVLIVVKWWFSVSGKLYRDKSIPSPTGESFIFGHIYAAGSSIYTEKGQMWSAKWCNTYPKLFRLRLGPYNVLYTSHAKFIRAIFKDNIEKTSHYRFLGDWLGDGLPFSKGNKWFSRRKLLTHSFHFELLKSYLDVFNETTNIMVDEMRETNGKPVEIFPKALSLTLDTILRCLVHYETNCQTQHDEYAQIMYRISLIVIKRVYNPLEYSDSIFLKTTTGKEYQQLKNRFYQINRKIIEDRKETHRKNSALMNNVKNHSFLDVLLTVKYEDGTNLSMEDILEEVNTFIWAGHDSTASGISWSLFQLAQQPEHMAKCYEEICEVFDAENGDQNVSQLQINALTHFSMCIKECLRLRSPVPYIQRHVQKDLDIEGYHIPQGTCVTVAINALHRLEEFWDNPLQFRPDRFSQEQSKGRDPYSYIPFSVGKRNCIGQNFAVTELKMAVAKIIYNFEVVAHEPEIVTRLYAVIQKPINLYLKFIPREHKGRIC